VGIFLAVGGIGLVILLVSLILGDVGDHSGILGTGDYLSLAAIAGFMAAFGFVGALTVGAGGTLVASAAGTAAGLLVGGAAGWFTRLLRRQQSAPAPGRSALIGVSGTVVSAIPSSGYGEVTLLVAGQQSKVNARSLEPVPIGTRVTVVAVLSPTSVQVDPVRGPTALPSDLNP
jgi:membrane protein implicated in regulation of membrane protease activity